jgi:hypothetical protein
MTYSPSPPREATQGNIAAANSDATAGQPAPRRGDHAATGSRFSSRFPRPEQPGEDSKGNAPFQIGNKMPGDHDRHRDGGGAGRAGRTWNGGGDGRLMTYDELASLEYPAEPDLARGSGILLLIARFERGG